jgi:hypothetical protein
MIILIMNKKFNRDDKQFKQYHQSKQPPLTLTHYPLAFFNEDCRQPMATSGFPAIVLYLSMLFMFVI